MIIKAKNIALAMLALSQALAVGHALSFTFAPTIACYCIQLLIGIGACQWCTVPPRSIDPVPQRLHGPLLWSRFLGYIWFGDSHMKDAYPTTIIKRTSN